LLEEAAMRGTIQERGKQSWRIRAYIGRDSTGTKRYVSRTVRGTRRDAERELSRLLVEVDEGRFVASPTMVLDELLDRWLEVKRQHVQPSTWINYEWVARTYVRPALGDRKIGTVRPIDLDLLYASLGGRGLSVRTVRICHTVLRQSLEQARKWGLIARSPAVDASPPTQHREEVDPPTLDQVLDLLETAYDKEPAFGVYLWVKSATGCRRGEMCALRWHDFDLDRREVRFRRAISKDYDGGLLEKDIKTHASRRLALDEGTVALLRQHRLRQREQALALGVPLADDALLFANAEGRPWRPDVCTNRFDRLRAKLDLKHVRLHDLRHFVASVLIDGGIPISTVSKRLGHSQMSTTLNIYTHAMPATDQKAADYLGDLLSKRKPPRANEA
jgi:integrase